MTSGSFVLYWISLFTAVAFVTLSAEAFAQSRPLTTRMSCSQAKGLVAAQGAIVLSTGPLTYDRYVRTSSACALGEVIEPAWVPTADSAQCPIGYRCASRNFPSRN
ncbi:hypothetical protein [Microvirga zambiensis]|uniref:hypothetical protein n=1 Tax=Microvirga zambiensis TaxID=1402137 RepID=UPI001AEF61DA|nr:hypothetical protein [Microvirga zambiensis]